MSDKDEWEIGSGGLEETGRPRGANGSARIRIRIGIGIGNAKAQEKSRNGVSVVNIIFQLYVADWHQSILYMRALAARFPSARLRAKFSRLGVS